MHLLLMIEFVYQFTNRRNERYETALEDRMDANRIVKFYILIRNFNQYGFIRLSVP